METGIKFVHRISKGSRYNQIYIPKEIESKFDVGDLVEVRLLERKNRLYYSKNLKRLSEFKESLIKDIFRFFSKYKEIKQIFVFGSFLTRKIEYNDIDIWIVSEKKLGEEREKEIYEALSDKFNLKFHIIRAEEENLNRQIKICPIVRSMFYYCVSDNEIEKLPSKELDENHIRFLLMFPEDLLKIDLDSSKIYYNNLRKLITIESFLKNKEIDPIMIDRVLELLIDKNLIKDIKSNEPIDKMDLKIIKKVIKIKLDSIHKFLKNGKKK